jgi:uncharacterized membrane protein HdeD (DUF308 family)
VLLRAAVAAVFGAVTIFWAQPSVQVLAWAVGLYLLGTAAAVSLTRTVAVVIPAVVGVAGVAALIFQSDAGVAASASLGLFVLGVGELVLGIRSRRRHVLARDWLVSGVIGIGTSAAIPLFVGLGAHALLGVAGGGAIISGVLWMLSGLTLRHDGRVAAARP